MKVNKISMAIVAAIAAPLAANAGVTVSPLLLGYHWAESIEDTATEQRATFTTGKDLYKDANGNSIDGRLGNDINGGVAMENGLYTGAALGIELTPSTQFQIEYGVANANGEASEASAKAGINRFDAEQEMITGNFLIGTDQVTGYRDNAFRPYVLIGGGQSKIDIENQEAYVADTAVAGYAAGQTVPAGTQVASSTDTIGNLGLGAMMRVNDSLSLRGEGRAVYNFDNSWWEGMALAGLEVVLGGHLAPTVVVPDPEPVEPEVIEPIVDEPIIVVVPEVEKDSDGDGVLDSVDQCPNTSANVVVDATGCAETVIVDDALQMELRVFFDNDKSEIKNQYKPEIAKVAEKMREYPNSTARIEGHASKTKRSSAKYNQRLSEARAIAVKSMLTNQFGVAPNRLSTVGYGFTRPIAPNDTPEGQAMNRRVYAVITGNKSMTVERTKDMVVQ